jgi:dTMP kinase
MKRAKYICVEGTDGVGKTTQVRELANTLKKRGFSVLQTKEPGTDLLPVTMQLRNLMLDRQYDPFVTKEAREFISQAIRSVHMQNVVYPALEQHDYVIQDRGLLSSISYGLACGNSIEFLEYLARVAVNGDIYGLYDHVVLLNGNISEGLNAAVLKKEFLNGDTMESKGSVFMHDVHKNMLEFLPKFKGQSIDVSNKSIEEVLSMLLTSLSLED